MARPSRVSVFEEPPPQIITVSEEPKPEKPPRVSVFVEPPPRTVTVSPPGYVQPEKPSRVSVFDPSTESAFDPFGGLLGGVFGEPTVRAEPIVTDICPAFCKITHIPSNIVSYEGNCSCGTMERYDNDPNYSVEVLTRQAEPEPTTEDIPSPEPEIDLPSIYGGQYVPGSVPTTEEAPGTVHVIPEEPEPEITTVQVEPPAMPTPTPTTPTPTPTTPTEERPVKWIPEPFFSFINEVFSE